MYNVKRSPATLLRSALPFSCSSFLPSLFFPFSSFNSYNEESNSLTKIRPVAVQNIGERVKEAYILNVFFCCRFILNRTFEMS